MKQLHVVIDKDFQECLYVNGKRWPHTSDGTIYVADLTEAADGEPVMLSHVSIEEQMIQWPNSLVEVFRVRNEATTDENSGPTIDRMLDAIYDEVDAMMRAGQLAQIDGGLVAARVLSLPLDVKLAWLTATLPVKCRLGQRTALYEHVAESYPDLLDGLGP